MKCERCGRELVESPIVGEPAFCPDFRCEFERQRAEDFAEWLSDQAKAGRLERLLKGKLEDVVLSLIQHCRDRCGAGFGKYPLGVRHAIGELLPLVDRDARGRNGYGEPTASIAEALAELDRRLER
jgi:hypothetical protein